MSPLKCTIVKTTTAQNSVKRGDEIGMVGVVKHRWPDFKLVTPKPKPLALDYLLRNQFQYKNT